MQPGPKIELANERLGQDIDIEAWVINHRKDDRSWQWISNRLTTTTDVQVSPQHLRRIYAEAEQTAESSAPA